VRWSTIMSAPMAFPAGCFNKRIDLATEHELIWGDYYLYEALHVLAGLLRPTLV
jgi:unsaturated chondroitin disaccharide hydrolase